MSGWAWCFRAARDQAVTLMTLVEITFLVSVTEYQAYTFFSHGMCVLGAGGGG